MFGAVHDSFVLVHLIVQVYMGWRGVKDGSTKGVFWEGFFVHLVHYLALGATATTAALCTVMFHFL
jgi:hypothetical protein